MLVDTSAWIEWLRATGSATERLLTQALSDGSPISVAGVVVQETLQGARNERHAAELAELFATCAFVEPVYPETYEHAASLCRACRRAGATVRGTVDCLVAAIALEHGLPLLAHDRDFHALARVSRLNLVA